ncbi:MAG: phosphotransferase, partial [Thermomicrobiales bacterium]
MIPAPPTDQALPGLAAIFDEDAMIPLLNGSSGPADGAVVTGYRPRYVRYKPGASCLVQADLVMGHAEGRQTTESAHLQLFLDNRGRRRAESSRMLRLRERARTPFPNLPWQGATLVRELNGLFQVYPIDYELRFLVRALDSAWMSAEIGAALADRSIAISGQPELIRYKPERKALLRYHLDHALVEGLYGKLQVDDRGLNLASATATLIDAGVVTPPIVISLPHRKFMAHAEAIGVPLAALRGTSGYVAWMEPLAASLNSLQGVQLAGLKTHRLADEVATLTQTARLLGTIAPHLARRLQQVTERIAVRFSGVDERLETGHGDFYDDQAIVSGDGLTLIDLDELRLAHPAIDAGNMLAHLSSGEVWGDDVATARAAFRERIIAYRPELAIDLDVFEAAALLKLAPGPFRRLEADWPEGLEAILNLAEASFHGHQGVGSRESSAAIDDPLLPQLARVRDAATMDRRLSCVIGDATVTGAHLVRHKPGRRAIVGYDLDNGEHFYGKSFASERGPKVYRIAQRICAAQAFGPDVALPKPVAYLADLKLLIQRAVAGEPVEMILRGGHADVAERIARALHHFHASGLDLGRTHVLAKELVPLTMRTEALVGHAPDLHASAWPLHDRLIRQVDHPFRWRYLPIHRDFYHDQMLIDGDRLAVLDLDDASMSEPTVDVANFAAHLRLLGFQ